MAKWNLVTTDEEMDELKLYIEHNGGMGIVRVNYPPVADMIERINLIRNTPELAEDFKISE